MKSSEWRQNWPTTPICSPAASQRGPGRPSAGGGQRRRAQRITVDEFAVRAALAELCNALAPEDVQAAKRALGRFVERIVLSKDGGEIFYHLPSMPQFGNQLIALKSSSPIAKAAFEYT